MAHHEHLELPAGENRRLEHHGSRLYKPALVVGVAGLLLAIVGAWFEGHGLGVRRFGFAYLTSYAFFLSLSLGGLFFVLIQHLSKAGWSVVVRRPAEVLAASMPILAVLFVPILIFVLMGDGGIYPWAQSTEALQAAAEQGHHGAALGDAHEQHTAAIVTVANQTPGHDEHGASAAAAPASEYQGVEPLAGHAAEIVLDKRGYLNPSFFIVRWVLYLAAWSGMGLWYWRQSTRQDESGDDALTTKMETLSGPALLVFGTTLTFAAFDLLMSLDPVWYSTIFGVYYFAGAFVGTIATMILMLMGLQRLGFCRSVSVEHFHDLGKLLFAFVFFWGYIAFSQYMLIWYANLPETTYWFRNRGFSTEAMSEWTAIGVVLLFGHLLIPFAALLPRWVKRNRKLLAFWAVWLLVLHWIDLFWLVMPQFNTQAVPFGLVELGCLVGIGGIFLGAVAYVAAKHSLVPLKDPRLAESLAFHNP